MSGSPKENLHLETGTEEVSDEREVFLRDGRTLVVRDHGVEQLVEIRNQSGLLEVRIRLTDEGPVLQMEAARLQLKATEAVEIESPRVAITGTEQLALRGGAVTLTARTDVEVEADGDVRVVGTKIHLN